MTNKIGHAGLGVMSLFLVIAASDALASPPKEPPPKPPFKECKLKITGNDWDFGYIPNKSEVTHLYRVKNESREVVEITNVRKLCGCSAAFVKNDILFPGDSTELSVTFSSGNYFGPISKAVFIESSDTVCPSQIVSFKTTIGYRGPELTFEPFLVDFDTIRALPSMMKVRLTNTDSRVISMSVLERGEGYASLRFSKRSLPPGTSGEMEIAVTKAPPPGAFHTSFTLVCKNPKKSRYTIPIQGVFIPAK